MKRLAVLALIVVLGIGVAGIASQRIEPILFHEEIRPGEIFFVLGYGFNMWTKDFSSIHVLYYNPISWKIVENACMSITLVNSSSTPQNIILFDVLTFNKAEEDYLYNLPDLAPGTYDVYIALDNGQHISFSISIVG